MKDIPCSLFMGKKQCNSGKGWSIGHGGVMDWIIVTSSLKATKPWPWLCMSRSIIQDSKKTVFCKNMYLFLAKNHILEVNHVHHHLDHVHHLPGDGGDLIDDGFFKASIEK